MVYFYHQVNVVVSGVHCVLVFNVVRVLQTVKGGRRGVVTVKTFGSFRITMFSQEVSYPIFGIQGRLARLDIRGSTTMRVVRVGKNKTYIIHVFFNRLNGKGLYFVTFVVFIGGKVYLFRDNHPFFFHVFLHYN